MERNKRYFVRGEGEVNEAEARNIDQALDRYMAGKFAGKSLEKTAEQNERFSWLIDTARNFAKSYGSITYDYKPEHIHILSIEDFRQIEMIRKDGLLAIHDKEGIIISDESLNKYGELNGLVLLVHELMHAFSCFKISLIRNGDKKVAITRPHRSGVSYRYDAMTDSQELRDARFSGLNEAITQEATRMLYKKVLRDAEQLRDLVANFDKNRDIDSSEFPAAAEYGIYGWVVQLFIDLCKKIKETHPDKFSTIDSVKDEFFRIYFSGKINNLKDLLDLAGSGCFGDLIEINEGADEENLVRIVNFRKRFGLEDDPMIQDIRKKQQKG